MSTTANAITVPTRDGHTFGGYYTETNGGGTQYITDKGFLTTSASTTNFTANGTLYAKWTAETYTIALDGQNATSVGTTAIYEIYGSKYSLTNDGTKAMSTTANAITAPTRTGYTFGGYYTEKNGGGTQYITDKGFLTTSASTTNFKAAGTLYAYWEDRIAPNVETTNSSVEYQQGQYVYLELASAIGTDSQTTSPSGGSVSVGLTTSLLYEIDIKNNMNLDEPWSEAYINNLDNYGTEYNIEYLDDYTADDEGFENAIYNLTDGLVCGYPKDSEYYDEAIKARIWEGIKFLRIDFDTAINLSGAEVYAQQHGNDNDSTSYGHWYYLGILASNEKHDKATGTNTVGFKKPCLTQKIGRAKAGVPLVVEADKTTTIEISYTDKGSGVTTIYGSNDNSSWTELISSSEGIETLAVAVEGLEGNGTYYFKAIDAKENESEAVGIPYGTNNGLLTLEENVSMKEGETKTLTASLTGEDGNLSDIEWESSDSDIITVTKGSNGEAILTAVGNKNETAIITAKIQINGIIYRAYCKAEILGADGIVYKIAKNNYNGIINIVANKSSYLTRVINVYDGGEGDDDGTVNGKITISSDKTYGDVKDCGTADSNAKRMVIVKYHGDVLIESGVTVTSVANEDGYGGPKGLYLCSTGTFENNGIISMTARGAKATGENVYLYSADRENWEYIPATGGAGGVGATITGNSSSLYYAEGDDGKPGTGRGTGGGGAGALSIGGTSKTNTSQPGTEGTSYSGGSGSGGISTYWYGIGNWSSYSAATAGGAGGMGVAAYGSSSSKITMNAGGGAGNPGQKGALVSTTAAYMDGSGFVFGGNNSSYKGSNGTGGLLIIYGNTVINKGTISSEGSSGGIGQTRTANGGSSGGGSINIFYANEYNNTEGKTNVEGGPSTGTLYNTTSISDENRQIPGGAGGSGTVTATKIDIE